MSRASRAVSQLVVALFAAAVVALALAAVTTGLAMAGHALPSDAPAPPAAAHCAGHHQKPGCLK